MIGLKKYDFNNKWIVDITETWYFNTRKEAIECIESLSKIKEQYGNRDKKDKGGK